MLSCYLKCLSDHLISFCWLRLMYFPLIQMCRIANLVTFYVTFFTVNKNVKLKFKNCSGAWRYSLTHYTGFLSSQPSAFKACLHGNTDTTAGLGFDWEVTKDTLTKKAGSELWEWWWLMLQGCTTRGLDGWLWHARLHTIPPSRPRLEWFTPL